MAVEKTPPRNGIILLLTLLTVGVLAILEPFFETYFGYYTERSHDEAVTAATDYKKLRAHEEHLLKTDPPIEQTMTEMGLQGQRSLRTFRLDERAAVIAPQPSTDKDPLIGWKPLTSK